MHLHRFLTALLAFAALLALGAGRAAADGDEAPENVTATVNAQGWVTVTWYHSGEGIYGFVLEQESPRAIRQIDQDKRIFTVADLEAGRTYRFRVCAVYADTSACSEYSNAVTTPMSQQTPPRSRQAPRITRHEVEPTSIKVWWSADRAWERFNVSWIEQGFGSGPEDVVGCDCGDGYMHIQKHVQPSRVYRVIVKGCDENFWGDETCSEWSAPFEVRTPAAVPPPPPTPKGVGTPTLKATVQSITSVALSFFVTTDTQTPDDRFIVYRDDAVIKEVPSRGVFGGLGGEHTDTVRSGADYAYKVCFRNTNETKCSEKVVVNVPGPAVPYMPGGTPTASVYAPELAIRLDGFNPIGGLSPARFLVIVSNRGRTGSDAVEFVVAFDGSRLLAYDVLQTAPGFTCQQVAEGFRCSGALDGRDGPRHEAYFVVRGWGASLGPSTVTATVDPTNRVAETDETNNTSRFATTVVDPASAPARCSRSAMPSIGRRCTAG